MKQLLAERNRKKLRQPRFTRQDAHKKKKLAKVWRRPKGYHNKMRRHVRGYRRVIKVGWGSPQEVKHTDQDGKKILLITGPADLQHAGKEHALIISKRIGKKKKLALLREIKQKGLTVYNITIDEYLTKAEKEIQEKKQLKEAQQKEKEKKKEEKAQKEKKSIEEKVEKEKTPATPANLQTEEEKKKKEKEEKDKVLTKRE
ncbi:MAG: eL32 family ribosomal protein [Nanoarchaeota archaeon]